MKMRSGMLRAGPQTPIKAENAVQGPLTGTPDRIRTVIIQILPAVEILLNQPAHELRILAGGLVKV